MQEFEEAKMDIDAKKRRLPKGTSEYQAAWILDNDFSDEETEEVDLQSPRPPGGNTGLDEAIELQSWDQDMEDADAEVTAKLTFRAVFFSQFASYTAVLSRSSSALRLIQGRRLGKTLSVRLFW